MNSLKLKYQQAIVKKNKETFEKQVNKIASLSFADVCRKIGFNNPNMVFSDNKNSIYQLRIVKKQNGYEVVQDRVDRKTLKSLLGVKSDELVNTVLDYADKNKQLKNPIAKLNYGFYYRRYGSIELHDTANFDNQIAMYNKESGEIKIFACLPPVVKQNYLNLFIQCLTPDFSVFLDWLALYTMEMRKGLKKPFLAVHGDFYFPLICLIESVYPQGFVVSQYKTIPTAMKFDKWETKCFVMTSNAIDYRRLAKISNHFAKTEHSGIYSNLSMVQIHFHSRIKNIQYAEATCFNVRLYDKNTQLNNIKLLGIEDYQKAIYEQIGDFCRINLNKRYKMLMKDEANLLNKFGVEFSKDDQYLTDKQCSDLLNYIVKKLKVVESNYFRNELFEFLKTGVISLNWIKNVCIDYKIKTEYFIIKAVELELLCSWQSEININGEYRIGYKLNRHSF